MNQDEKILRFLAQQYREAAFTEENQKKKELQKAVVLFGYSTSEWDAPDEEMVKTHFDHLVEIAKNL